jgi:hypothetical protein
MPSQSRVRMWCPLLRIPPCLAYGRGAISPEVLSARGWGLPEVTHTGRGSSPGPAAEAPRSLGLPLQRRPLVPPPLPPPLPPLSSSAAPWAPATTSTTTSLKVRPWASESPFGARDTPGGPAQGQPCPGRSPPRRFLPAAPSGVPPLVRVPAPLGGLTSRGAPLCMSSPMAASLTAVQFLPWASRAPPLGCCCSSHVPPLTGPCLG